MELSEFTFRLILIFIPGLISFVIIDFLTTHKEIKLHMAVIYSLILGFMCYFFYYSIIQFVNLFPNTKYEFCFLASLSNKESKLNFVEIVFVTCLSIPVGLFFTRLINYAVVFKIARKFKITEKPGYIDIWTTVMQSNIPNLVLIKDKEEERIYYGWISLFSHIKDVIEIFLVDVTVYELSNNVITNKFNTGGLYLLKKSDNIVVQFPYLTMKEIEESANE